MRRSLWPAQSDSAGRSDSAAGRSVASRGTIGVVLAYRLRSLSVFGSTQTARTPLVQPTAHPPCGLLALRHAVLLRRRRLRAFARPQCRSMYWPFRPLVADARAGRSLSGRLAAARRHAGVVRSRDRFEAIGALSRGSESPARDRRGCSDMAARLHGPLLGCGCARAGMATLTAAITGGLPMPDLLDSIRGQLRARLDELRPLVREYERLQGAERAPGDARPISAKRAARTKLAEPRRSGVRGRLHGGARARRSSAKPTGRRSWTSSASDPASPGLSSRAPRACPARALPRTCGGCSTAARCAKNRCRAARPATGSETARTSQPQRARSARHSTNSTGPPAHEPTGAPCPERTTLRIQAGPAWPLGVPY